VRCNICYVTDEDITLYLDIHQDPPVYFHKTRDGCVAALKRERDHLNNEIDEQDRRIEKLERVVEAAKYTCNEARKIHDTEPYPVCFRAPYGGLVKMIKALQALSDAAKECSQRPEEMDVL